MLSVIAIVWFGPMGNTPFLSMNAPPNYGTAEAQVVITLPAVSMPTTLKARVGETTSFPIAIHGTDPVEGLGTIAISRLPQGSTFSTGVAHDGTTWKLKPSEIENLYLKLPRTSLEETTLMIELLAPDGHVISDAVTIVEVVSVPQVGISVRRVKTQAIQSNVWDQLHQSPEAMDAKAELEANGHVPLPTRRPELRRSF